MKILFPNEVVLETKHFKVAQDWEVPIAAFFIISTQRKINSVMDFNDEEAKEFTPLVKKIRQGMKNALDIKEVYLFQNEDSSHGFHLWMLPRYAWMNEMGKKVESVRPIMEYATKTFTTEDAFMEIKEKVEQMKKYFEQHTDSVRLINK